MYSFTRSWIGPKEARMLIHDSVVVRTTRTADRPSTPTLYWIPKTGIQSTVSLYEKPGFVGSNWTSITSDSPKATSAVVRAAIRIARWSLAGMNAMTSAPMSGVKVIALSHGSHEVVHRPSGSRSRGRSRP